MKIYTLINFICISFFCFVSCSKPIRKIELIGTWKSKDNQLIILKNDSSFMKKNLKNDIQIGKWEITMLNNQNILKLISEKKSETFYLEKSFFNRSFTIIKWIGDPDDYNREEYTKDK